MTSSLTGCRAVAPGSQWTTTRGPIRLVTHATPTRIGRPAGTADAERGATAVAVAVRFAELLSETMRGIRPVGQLRSVAVEQCLTELSDVLRHPGMRTARCVRVRAGAPRAGVLDAVACYTWQPGAGHPARTFAVTFRLRHSSRGWRCTQLDVVVATGASAGRRTPW